MAASRERPVDNKRGSQSSLTRAGRYHTVASKPAGQACALRRRGDPRPLRDLSRPRAARRDARSAGRSSPASPSASPARHAEPTRTRELAGRLKTKPTSAPLPGCCAWIEPRCAAMALDRAGRPGTAKNKGPVPAARRRGWSRRWRAARAGGGILAVTCPGPCHRLRRLAAEGVSLTNTNAKLDFTRADRSGSIRALHSSRVQVGQRPSIDAQLLGAYGRSSPESSTLHGEACDSLLVRFRCRDGPVDQGLERRRLPAADHP